MRGAGKRLLVFSATPLLLAGCPQSEDARTSGTPWTSHRIGNQFSGADGVKLGDLDGDGRVDLVVPWEESGAVTIHLNPGPAQVRQPWPAVQVGAPGATEDAVLVDLDGDGHLDVVSCSQGDVRTVHVHWAPADSSRCLDPSAWTTEAIPATQGAREWMFCEPAQIDGENGIDLVIGAKGDDGQVGWLEAPHQPRNLAEWRWHPLASVGWTMSVVAVDLNGDGLLDIVVSDRKGPTRGCFWLRNPESDLLRILPWPIQRISGTDHEVMFLDVADLDNDGQLDVVAATSRRQLSWHQPLDARDVIWSEAVVTWSDRFGTGKSVRVADVDLDGQRDIVFTCENARGGYGVGWLARQQVGITEFWLARPVSGDIGRKFDLAQVLDLDDDGDMDVVTCEEAAGLGVLWYENPTITASSSGRSG
jgi:hypothetical protein